MINTSMVFVLGAGASADFHFPVGQGLLRIVANWRGNSGPIHSFKELGYSERDLQVFCEALHYSGEASIDAFLEKRPEFMEIGKTAMAIELIGREQTGYIFEDPNGSNWMKYLLGKMQGRTFEEFAENKVSFVTFNYDRVIEHFLFTALKNAWGKSDEEVGALLSKLPFIHLHGRLGYLPWQSTTGKDVRAFDPALNTETIRVAASGIKVVHEGVEDRKQEFGQAKQFIRGAARVYFLGVGTSNINLERIGVPDFEPNKAYATLVGVTDMEYREVTTRYSNKLHFRRDHTCRDMISNCVEWD
jgi:hypothetical protein